MTEYFFLVCRSECGDQGWHRETCWVCLGSPDHAGLRAPNPTPREGSGTALIVLLKPSVSVQNINFCSSQIEFLPSNVYASISCAQIRRDGEIKANPSRLLLRNLEV